jgi:FdhE protein
MTPDDWLRAHAYLQPLAHLEAQVEDALERTETGRPAIPSWVAYAAEFGAGVPLLSSAEAAVDLEPMGAAVVALVSTLARTPLGERLAPAIRHLEGELRAEPNPALRAAEWLIGDETFTPSSPGLLRFLGWKAGARHLAPLVDAFAGWRDDERWLRSYCPTCGSKPAMAQLVGLDPGRKRFLACGCCRTRWQYTRTRCPFCEEDPQRIAVVTFEGEAGLRLDSCTSCKGYLKTLEGGKDGDFLLADWTSLHLDVAARDRGLERKAASLYELGTSTAAAE